MRQAPTAVPVLEFDAHGYEGGLKHGAHQHDALHFSLILQGTVAETVHHRSEFGAPLSIVAKDAGVVHANQFSPAGARLARLTLPSGTIAQLLDDPSRGQGWRWTHDPAVAAPFLRLVRRAARQSACFAAHDPDVVDLLASFTARPAAPIRGEPPAWLVQVMRCVRDEWYASLRVATLARDAGVHPVYLARCVRRWFQTTLGEELRRARLRAAAAAIANGGGTLSAVAHETGFADEPHLNREFRAAVGLTPGRFRALTRPGPSRCAEVAPIQVSRAPPG